MSATRVLLIGGHGQTAQLMTIAMLANGWDVTSIIRTAAQEKSILQLAKNTLGNIDVIIADLHDIRCTSDARLLIDQAKPSIIVFAAGSMSEPFLIDRDAARCIMEAAADSKDVIKYLQISFPASREKRAPWWSNGDVKEWQSETRSFPDIQRAKLEADQHLATLIKNRGFQGISLRPSWLLNGKGRGQVLLGKTPAASQITRADVASVAIALLERDDTKGWFDVVEGSTPIHEAVNLAVSTKIGMIGCEGLDPEV